MKNSVLNFVLVLFALSSSAQTKSPEDYGFRHVQTVYKGDTVDILIKSQQGEEQKAKPLFLFCQGSLPIPLIIYSEQGLYGVFPFNTDSLVKEYHLAIISKPYIPLVRDAKTLNPNFTYNDSLGKFPAKYSERNYLYYYVNRNIAAIKFLQKQTWIDNKQLVVAGHSEGSTIAAKMASIFSNITHLIYAGGNPMGRIMSIITQSRSVETDSIKCGEEDFKYWQAVVANPADMDVSQGDTYRATYDFSKPPIEYLEKLNIPVMVSYGTKDWSAPFNDYLRVEMIRQGKTNFTFMAYIGTDHNFFPLLPNGKPDYNIYNWDKVGDDWMQWLKSNW